MKCTANPYEDGTREHHAWHRGYAGLIFLSADPSMNSIYDTARQTAIDDCFSNGHVCTDILREVEDGHVFYKLAVNNHVVFKSLLEPVVQKLKDELDKALLLA